MQKKTASVPSETAHLFSKPCAEISTPDLKRYGEEWVLDGDMRQLSGRTLEARRFLIAKLVWHLEQRKADSCGSLEIRAFMAYLNNGHEKEGGRWGNPRMNKAVRPLTTTTYFSNLRTFFRYLVAEGHLAASPMETFKPPVARADQIQPFTPEQLNALLAAAGRSMHPRRDTAIVLFLYDTGARASELCGLRLRDVDMKERSCSVRGKGNKVRVLRFGSESMKALWAYLKQEPHEDDDPLFMADRGTRAGDPLTRSGLLQLVERLGRAAKLENCRCSPHTFRHTFAIDFLRNGGEAFALKELLGHTTLAMTNKYVSFAQADLKNQHRQFSPADRLKRRP